MSILHVVFKIGDSEYALPASEVVQMESYSGATPVPGAPPYIAGLVQVRGRVLPVLDLRARFGLDPIERTLDTRLVVGQDGARSVALLVDSAREVLKIDPAEIEPPPAMLESEARGFIKAVARTGKRLVLLINFQKVIGEERLDGNQ